MVPELNQLNINSFVVDIVKLPYLKYTVQEVTFPDVSLPEVQQYTPFQHINQAGDHIVHDDLSFQFVVDEKMNNWRGLYHWMSGLTFPDSFEQFEKLLVGDSGSVQKSLRNQFSDVNITILSNHKNPIIRYTLHDAFPVNLSGFSVNVTDQDTVPVTASCSMKFTGFKVEVL